MKKLLLALPLLMCMFMPIQAHAVDWDDLTDVPDTIANIDMFLASKSFTNHTHEISDTNGLLDELTSHPINFENADQIVFVKQYYMHATVASGVATFYLTSDGTSGGSAICSDHIIPDSINTYVSDASASYQTAYVINNIKQITITVNKLTTANILTGLLGQTAANGAVLRLQVACK